MSRRGNAWRCVAATLVTVMLAIVASPALAQEPETLGAVQRLPEATDATNAYRTVRRWLDAFSLPAPEAAESEVPVRNAGGVCIVLRRSGRVIAIGTDHTGGPLMVRRAAQRAFGRVLADPAVQALGPQMRESIGTLLTLELELAAEPIPIVGRTVEQIDARLDPGLDAIAVRRGGKWAWMFPSQLRATGRPPSFWRHAKGMLRDLGLELLDVDQALEDHPLRVYRAPTVNLAQRIPSDRPFQALRGQAVVPDRAVTAASIVQLADGIARHLLLTRFQTPPGEPFAMVGVMGDYRAAVDEFKPLLAPPLEQALVAMGLFRYADAPGVDTATAADARILASLVLNALAVVESGESDPRDDLRSCAAILHALRAGGENVESGAELRRLRADALAAVIESFRPDRGFVEGDTPLGPHGQALLAGATMIVVLDAPDNAGLQHARQTLDAAWASASGPGQVGLLPWIGWAELDFATATGEPSPKRDALRELQLMLDAAQLAANHGAAADLHGGFSLRGDSGTSRATSQSLRPAAYLATALRHASITGASSPTADLGRHLKSMRFLMQLTVQEEWSWWCRHPDRAVGGVLAAPWSTDQPAAAQALGLLTAAETLISLQSLMRPDSD